MPPIKPRHAMPSQDPEQRRRNFEEVATGYLEPLALGESSRCLTCPKPGCYTGCPVNVNIKDFVALVKEGKYLDAYKKIKETNSLPAVCGRVCPQEEQCEKFCLIGKRNEPVAVGRLERSGARK